MVRASLFGAISIFLFKKIIVFLIPLWSGFRETYFMLGIKAGGRNDHHSSPCLTLWTKLQLATWSETGIEGGRETGKEEEDGINIHSKDSNRTGGPPWKQGAVLAPLLSLFTTAFTSTDDTRPSYLKGTSWDLSIDSPNRSFSLKDSSILPCSSQNVIDKTKTSSEKI